MIRRIRMEFLKMSYSMTLIVTLILYLLAGHLAALKVIALDSPTFTDIAYALLSPNVIVLSAAAVLVSDFVHMEGRDGTMKGFVASVQDKGAFSTTKFWTLAIYSLFFTIAEGAVLVIESLIRVGFAYSAKDIGFACLIALGIFLINLSVYGTMELIAILIKGDAMSVFIDLALCWGLPAAIYSMTGIKLSPDNLKEMALYAGVALIWLIIVEMISAAVVRVKEVR